MFPKGLFLLAHSGDSFRYVINTFDKLKFRIPALKQLTQKYTATSANTAWQNFTN